MDDVAKSFYNSLQFLRNNGVSASGFGDGILPVAGSEEEARYIINGPGKADGLPMAESAKRAFDFIDNLRNAESATLYFNDNDQSKSAVRTDRYKIRDLEPFMDIDVAQNYEGLNQLLDDFDGAGTLEEKNNVLKSYLDQNPNASEKRRKMVSFLGEMVNNPQPWPTNEASDRMRMFLKDIRNRYFRVS